MTLLLSVATPKNTIKVHGTLVADLKHHDRRLTRQTSIFELSIKRPTFLNSSIHGLSRDYDRTIDCAVQNLVWKSERMKSVDSSDK